MTKPLQGQELTTSKSSGVLENSSNASAPVVVYSCSFSQRNLDPRSFFRISHCSFVSLPPPFVALAVSPTAAFRRGEIGFCDETPEVPRALGERSLFKDFKAEYKGTHR